MMELRIYPLLTDTAVLIRSPYPSNPHKPAALHYSGLQRTTEEHAHAISAHRLTNHKRRVRSSDQGLRPSASSLYEHRSMQRTRLTGEHTQKPDPRLTSLLKYSILYFIKYIIFVNFSNEFVSLSTADENISTKTRMLYYEPDNLRLN